MTLPKLFVFLIVFLASNSISLAYADDGEARLHLLVFYSHNCPHCNAQKPFLELLEKTHPSLTVYRYDVQEQAVNALLFQQVANSHGVSSGSVPSIFVGGRAWIGDSRLIRDQISSYIEGCLTNGNCPDSRLTEQQFSREELAADSTKLNIPLIGSIDLNIQPVILSTALIAFIDGFNPCSLWVLTILLALVIHSGSRKRIIIVGLTFLLVTASIYGLFIVGVFGALNLMAMAGWLYPVVALFALVFALVNIKDYFWFQRGLSFTIDEKHKPGIYRRIRNLMSETYSMPTLIGATALMAGGVAFIELPCTAGFPVIWSGIIAGQNIGTPFFLFLLALYLLIYLSIELVIFFIALKTLRINRFQEHHGRILKLIGGIIMLALAGVLVFAPQLMQSFSGALSVFAGAFSVTILVLFLHRYLLPKMGIYFGDEERGN